MPSVVIFYHPGAEHSVTRAMLSNGIMPWSTYNFHRRKFLETSGEYITSGMTSPVAGKLRFWGEWEPDSHVKKIPDATPKFIHVPFLRKPLPAVRPHAINSCGGPISCGGNMPTNSTNRYQNTDPFVFADNFFYSVCQQITHSGKTTQMTKLDVGSIILFGSRINKDFALDTVFVVGDKKPYTASTIVKDLSGFAPSVYPKIMQLSPGKQPLVCYKGASYSAQTNGMYSFVPCQICNNGFERPILTASDFIGCSKSGIMSNGPQNQGRKVTDVTDAEAKAIWDCVRNAIQRQGFLEGFNFKY